MECTARVASIEVDIRLTEEERALVTGSRLKHIGNLATLIVRKKLNRFIVCVDSHHDHSGFMRFSFNTERSRDPRTPEEAKNLVEQATEVCLSELRQK